MVGKYSKSSFHWSATNKTVSNERQQRDEISTKDTAKAKAETRTACGMKEDQNHLMELSVDFFS